MLTPELLERRILAIGVDPGVIPRIIEVAVNHGAENDTIGTLPANIFEIKALPQLAASSALPPRRASKRAQRSKIRPWTAR